MGHFIFIPERNIKISLMLSDITVLNGGKYDHTVTFLIENQSEKAANEFLIIYPYTFPSNLENLFRVSLREFKPKSQLKEKVEETINWKIYDEYKHDPNSSNFFDYNNRIAKESDYQYRRLDIDGKFFQGWVYQTPIISRVEEDLELLSKIGIYGYSIFKVKFRKKFIEPKLPLWVRLEYKADIKSEGLLDRLIDGLKKALRITYFFYDPFSVKNNFIDELNQKTPEDSELESQSRNKLCKLYKKLMESPTNVTIENYYLYLRFKDVDESDPVTLCETSITRFIRTKIPYIGGSCYRFYSDNLLENSECKITISVKDKTPWLNFFKNFLPFNV